MKFYLFGTLRPRFLMQSVFLAVFFVSAPIVRADIITFEYEGELTEVDSLLEGSFSVGDSFTGTYTFDSDTPRIPEDIDQFTYRNAIIDMSFNSGHFIASANSGSMSEDHMTGPTTGFTTLFESFSSSSIAGLYPNRMHLFWNTSHCSLIVDPDPCFNPYYPTPWDRFINGIHENGEEFEDDYINYFDVNGNLVFSYDIDAFGIPNQVNFTRTRRLGLIGNPNQLLFDSDGRARYNGHFFLSFEAPSTTIRGRLNSVTLISNILTLIVPNNKWVQLGLNTAPPTGSTVADIIGDDILAPYNSEWVIYSYETSTNSYKKLSLTDTMLPGQGYWFIQTTGNPVTIDMPDKSTDVNVRQSPACSSFEGCFEIPLQTSSSYEAQWQMIGYPFRDNGAIDKIRVVTAGIGSGCFTGCTLAQANEKHLVSEPLYHYDGTSYELLTTNGDEPFEPWDGAWIATLPSATGQNLTLLIPATN